MPEPTIEERIAELERVARELTSNNAIAKENFASLRNAFDVDLPAAFKGQDDATRSAIVALDGAIATLRKHAEGFHQLLDLLDGRLTRLEVLLESRQAGTVN
jgi:hypothetical protein